MIKNKKKKVIKYNQIKEMGLKLIHIYGLKH